MPVVVWSRRFAEGPRAPPNLPIRIASSPEEVADAADILSLHLALAPETNGIVESIAPEQVEAGLVRHQHGARRHRRLRGARTSRSRPAHPRRVSMCSPGTVRRRCGFRQRHHVVAERVRHAAHRRIDRPGTGSHRRGNGPRRRQLQNHRQSAERGEPGAEDARHARPRRPPPRPPGRARTRVRVSAKQRHQRSGNGERDFRGRRGRRRSNQRRLGARGIARGTIRENRDIIDLHARRAIDIEDRSRGPAKPRTSASSKYRSPAEAGRHVHVVEISKSG